MTNKVNHNQDLLQVYRGNLQRLEKQIALHGGEMTAPLPLLNQRDEALAEIERLEGEVEAPGQRILGAALPESPAPEQSGLGAARQADLDALYQKLDRYFDREELRTLCFRLGVDYDSLPAEGKSNKARELVQHCARHELVSSLVEICSQLRPRVSW